MKKLAITAAATAATLMLASAGHAASDNADSAAMQPPKGDIEAGEKAFRQCASCHVVKTDEGETLAGRNARTGPNLYGVATGPIAHEEGFRYSKSMQKLGEQGLNWNEEEFVGYVQDPTGWLREMLDDDKARGKMAFKVRKEEDAHDLYAYLYSLAPPAEGEDAEAASD
ncbi:cytochrome C [Roseovarius spongiae]|uniref:Cytochrome C n=1 Tax=Roseovarius spongiae TaxID=2320272 RepID=A0A3A8B3E5_9RHOB|nr:c-type cytochrome [Roseovarius spongiae]RKF15132.1 cytochrome C [Roseovarius spongiae]